MLRTLQAAADNQGVGSEITWDALNNAGREYGFSINEKSFRSRFEAEEAGQIPADLHNVVDSYDENKIVLKTNTQLPTANTATTDTSLTTHKKPKDKGFERARKALKKKD